MFDRLPFVHPSPLLLAIDALVVTLFCALAIVWIALVRASTHNRVAVVAHGVFAAYLVVLASLLFLPLHGIRAAAESFEGTDPLRRAWYWGLHVRSPFVHGRLEWQRFANIVLTIPFGFGFGLLAPRLGVRRIVAACMAWAVSLELIQLTISVLVGFVYRTFDVNDIIDNAFGAWIGLSLFIACALVVRSTGFGAGCDVTTLSGFIADSVERYFEGYRRRRNPDVPVDVTDR